MPQEHLCRGIGAVSREKIGRCDVSQHRWLGGATTPRLDGAGVGIKLGGKGIHDGGTGGRNGHAMRAESAFGSVGIGPCPRRTRALRIVAGACMRGASFEMPCKADAGVGGQRIDDRNTGSVIGSKKMLSCPLQKGGPVLCESGESHERPGFANREVMRGEGLGGGAVVLGGFGR